MTIFETALLTYVSGFYCLKQGGKNAAFRPTELSKLASGF